MATKLIHSISIQSNFNKFALPQRTPGNDLPFSESNEAKEKWKKLCSTSIRLQTDSARQAEKWNERDGNVEHV